MVEGERDGGDQPRSGGWRAATAALHHRDFAVFFVGALASNTGAWMSSISIPYVVLQLTDSPAMVSVSGFFLFVPIVAMGPLGGVLADRFDRRTLLLQAQAGQAVVAAALAVAWTLTRSLPLILVLVVVAALINGVSIPAWQAFVSELVPREALLNAVTLNSAQFNGAKALGPALGGLVLWRFGPGAAFAVNAFSYVAVIVALLLVRPGSRRREAREPGPRVSVGRAFVATLRYSRRRPGIVACFAVVTALGGLGSPFVQLIAVFARDVHHVGDAAYGLLAAGLGIGAMVSLPVVVGRGATASRARMVSWAMGLYGVAVVVFGASPWYGLSLAALFVAGGGYLALAASLNTTIQLQVDEAMRGQVLAVYVMLLTASLPAGLLVQAGVVRFLGPRLTVVLAGVAFAAVHAWLRLRTSYLAHLDDERAEEAAPPRAA